MQTRKLPNLIKAFNFKEPSNFTGAYEFLKKVFTIFSPLRPEVFLENSFWR